MLAVAGLVWGIVAVILIGSVAVLVRASIELIRRLKDLKATVGAFNTDLSGAMREVTEGLERAEEGMGRIRGRGLRT